MCSPIKLEEGRDERYWPAPRAATSQFTPLRPSTDRDASRAEDLVQTCVVRALANQDRWAEGTNLRGWLFTILHNEFVSQYGAMPVNAIVDRPPISSPPLCRAPIRKCRTGSLSCTQRWGSYRRASEKLSCLSA